MHISNKSKFSRFSEVYYLIIGNLQCIWWDIDHLRLISWFIFFIELKKTLVPMQLPDCFYLPILNYWCFELIRFEFFWTFIQINFKCSWKYERNTCILAICAVSSMISWTFILSIKYPYEAIMSLGTCSYRNW